MRRFERERHGNQYVVASEGQLSYQLDDCSDRRISDWFVLDSRREEMTIVTGTSPTTTHASGLWVRLNLPE